MKDALYIANIDFLNDDNAFLKYYNAASIERKKKIDSYRLYKDKCLSLCAEMLLKYSLADNGNSPENLTYAYNEYGKPYLKEYPEFHFSFSHSGEFAVCAVSDAQIGCDIEKITDINLKVAERFFSNEEYEYIISKHKAEEKKQAFFDIWTLKESYIKAIGTGIKTPLSDFTVSVGDAGNITLKSSKCNCDFFQIEEINGYKCAICKIGKIETVKLHKIVF